MAVAVAGRPFETDAGRGSASCAEGLPRRLPWTVGAFVGLVLAEFVGLALAFDSGAVTGETVLAELFDVAPAVVRVGVVSAALALLFVGASGLRTAAGEIVDYATRHPRRWTWWTGHVASVALFAGLTWMLLHGAGGSASSFVLVVTWCATALAAVVTAALVVAPSVFWIGLASRHWKVLPAAVACGAATVGLGTLAQWAWQALGVLTFAAVEAVLRLGGLDVQVDAGSRVIGADGFLVRIASSCSGCEGLGLGLVFVTSFLVVFRRDLRFPRALLLVPIVIAAMFITNVLRIALLVAIGTHVSPSLALGGFHSQAGWLGFLAVATGLLVVGLECSWLRRPVDESAAATDPPTGKTGAYLAPLIALFGTGMLLTALCSNELVITTSKYVAAALAIWCSRGVLAGVFSHVSPWAIVIGAGMVPVWMLVGSFEAGTAAAAVGRLESWWLVSRMIGSVLVVPVVEELGFRGYLMRRLVSVEFDRVDQRDVPVWAVLASSVAFGLLHEWWVAGALAGVVYAGLARRWGLGAAIVGHAVTNAGIAVAVVGFGQRWLW